MSKKRFRIAFSFAGEKRDFVKETADILAKRFGEASILYDKFYEARFARSDLGIYLPDLYHKETELIVLVICKDYETKEWCGLEWTAIHALIKERNVEDVMLCRFDHALVKGLYSTAGFVELDQKTSEEVADLILERLADNEGKPKDHYTKPVVPPTLTLRTSIPHNLPTLQPFFGREDELRKIADALDPDSRTWGALIDGPGGMGKTSLAVRAAYDASPEVFKKIIFISLKTRELDDDGLRDLSGFILSGLVELLNELARELGCDDIAKAPEDQRPRLLLDALRSTQTLLVLDNLESLIKSERDTLFTFVKKLPTGCKAILTSRGRIGSGAEELILEALSQEAALETLAELATHNPLLAQTSEAERLVLYRETGGKPLLLRWTAGQLGRGHCLTFTDALHFIRSCPPGNDPLEFIFGDLVEDFDDHETQALCALTYFTLPTEVKHVAAIAGLPMPDTNRALRSLANRSLAVPSIDLTTFTLVPMVAEFLLKKQSGNIRQIGNRLAVKASELVKANGSHKHHLFHVLEAAWPMIAAAFPVLLAGANSDLQMFCRRIAHFLEFKGLWDIRLFLFQKAEAKAAYESDFFSAGMRSYQQATIYYLRHQADKVEGCLELVEDYWTYTRSDGISRAKVALLRGYAFELRGKLPEAAVAFQKSLDELRSLGDDDGMAKALKAHASIELQLGNLKGAENGYRRALEIARKIANDELIAASVRGLADVSIQLQDWPRVVTLAQEALVFSEKLLAADKIAGNLHRLAHALAQQGKTAEALPHARRAVEIYTRLGLPNLAEAQATLAECEG